MAEPVHKWEPGHSDRAHDEALFSVTNAVANLEALREYESSRALSLAITKAQECAMWMAWHDAEQGREVSVFPSSGHEDEELSGFAAGGFIPGYPASRGEPMRSAASPSQAGHLAIYDLVASPPVPADTGEDALADAMTILKNARAR